MLREQIERAQKMARTDDGSEQDGAADPAATELRREELDAPLGFQLAAGRAAAAAAAAEQQQQQQRPKPAVAFDEDGGAGGGAGQQRGGKRSKIEELMEKVGGLGAVVAGWAGWAMQLSHGQLCTTMAQVCLQMCAEQQR